MIDKIIIKMSAWMMSGLIFCPLITMAQIYTVQINVEETPFISDITIECIEQNAVLSVHLENPVLQASYTLVFTIPPTNDMPETNTSGIFIIPNLLTLQTAVFETNYGFCTDSKLITFNCSAILPVTIINVYANIRDNDKADITWEIASEKNVKHYIVEESATGVFFEPIGTVPASIDVSNFKTYTYEDKALFSGINYYRIKIEDWDGTTYYTKIVSVNSTTDQIIGFKIYPNPTTNNLFVEYANNTSTILELSIYNQLGQLMTSSTYTDGLFSKKIELSLIDLAAGTYIIKAVDQHGNERVTKFFKMI